MGKKFKFKSSKQKRMNLIKNRSDEAHDNLITGFRIEILSNIELIIDGCTGILDYNEDYIKLKLKRKCVLIFGSSLSVLSFEEEHIKIGGILFSLEFIK